MILLHFTNVRFACFSMFLDHSFLLQGERHYSLIKPQFQANPHSSLEGDNQHKLLVLEKEGSGARIMAKE